MPHDFEPFPILLEAYQDGAGVPDRASILQDWTHHTFISCFLHISGAGEKSSPQETKCSIGFSINIADMRIPFQIICNCYTTVFDDGSDTLGYVGKELFCGRNQYLSTFASFSPQIKAQHVKIAKISSKFGVSAYGRRNLGYWNYICAWSTLYTSFGEEFLGMTAETPNLPNVHICVQS